jgi:L-ascorbate metabolism protein UlaG (beta-lactamase superfamily)
MLLLILSMIPVALGFAHWLGWGRRLSLEVATGWSLLEPTDRQRFSIGTDAIKAEADAPLILWHGHATFSIEWGGTRLAVDPLLGRAVALAPRLFPGHHICTKKTYDAILLTHAHMDHFSPQAVAALNHNGIILPPGTERFLRFHTRANSHLTFAEIGQSIQVGELEIIPLFARHGGWRYPWQYGLEARSYLVRRGKRTLYLAGDTAWGSHFAEIGERYSPDYAALPIGAYAPTFFLQKRHMNPEEAVNAAIALGARFVIPFHFGTLRLSLEPLEEPLVRFALASRKADFSICFPVAHSSEYSRQLSQNYISINRKSYAKTHP